MRRRIFQVIIQLLYILAMVAFGVTEAKVTLLNDRVLFVPQTDSKAKNLIIVRDAADTLLAPAISFTAGHIVGNIIPGIAVCAVIFAHGPPLAVAEVWTPVFPGRIFQANLFFIHFLVVSNGRLSVAGTAKKQAQEP